jgi:hypothetical protein
MPAQQGVGPRKMHCSVLGHARCTFSAGPRKMDFSVSASKQEDLLGRCTIAYNKAVCLLSSAACAALGGRRVDELGAHVSMKTVAPAVKKEDICHISRMVRHLLAN